MKKSLLIALAASALLAFASPAFATGGHGFSAQNTNVTSNSSSGVIGGSAATASSNYGASGALAGNETGAFNQSGAQASNCGCNTSTVETYSESGQTSLSGAATFGRGSAAGLGGGFAGGSAW